MNTLVALAQKNIKDVLDQALLFTPKEQALVIYDTDAPLTTILLEAYRGALPQGEFIDFHAHTPEQILARINALAPKDLVVVLQSTNFRLNEFRLRIELFKRELKTIEHLHLLRISESQFERYIQALSYDKEYYHTFGHGLKKIIDNATEIVVTCDGTTLTYAGGMEDSKLNIGDYSGMKNVGGTYPIGEVFSEAKDLTRTNGKVKIFGYADSTHMVQIVPPFTGIIVDGVFSSPDAPPDFQKIMDMVSAEEKVWVREFGMGLNPTMSKHAIVNDITAFERQRGMHMSLGAKHAIYQKPGLNRKDGRYHIDVFVDIETITMDGRQVYKNGEFTV